MEKKPRTIDIIKQKRKVPESVTEGRKKYNSMKKAILEALKDEAKTIPQIASETKISLPETTYYLMALQKFGEVSVQGLDDMDEYYFYELKKK
jgi:predicted Rossmann fold nucleotide-binding protein DprA/Smf involved in DNA uptake